LSGNFVVFVLVTVVLDAPTRTHPGASAVIFSCLVFADAK
jgi:hypothetical protein